jgi:hypothetical protein
MKRDLFSGVIRNSDSAALLDQMIERSGFVRPRKPPSSVASAGMIDDQNSGTTS